MNVAVVGEGPAVAAVEAALADVGARPTIVDPAGISSADLAVAVDDAGGDSLADANRVARESDVPWLAVELGGVGGHPLPEVEASVTGLGPGAGCYECLRGRVGAAVDEAGDPGSGERGRGDSTLERFVGAIAGRAAARLVDGGETTILGRIVEVPHASRRFLPLPGCDWAPDREWTLALAHEPADLEEALARAEGALDPRVGPIREVGEVESFPAPYYLAELCETAGFSDASAAAQAAGVAADWNGAFMKALGESLERYSAGVYRTAGLETGTAAAVEGAVAPDRFVGSPTVAAPAPADELAWVPGLDLHGRSPVRLPASLVLFPPPAERGRPATTTGLALGSSTVEAVLAGLYETVERDAAMLAWYSTYEPLELAVEDDAYETLVRRAGAEGLAVTAQLLTQDVDVPVVGVAVHRADGAWPRFAVGMGASLEPAAAARSALAEALQNWMELRGMGREAAAEESTAIGHYADFPEAARSFVATETRVPADSVAPATVPAGEAALRGLVDRLDDAGLDAYAARLTPPDVGMLGFEAVRVLVPSAQPLFTGRPYFGERAETVPRELGFEPRLNAAHHPFP